MSRMFDSLLGPKFSNKCKHSVKGIKCRLEAIRKKKHAMVRYLKRDVADLIANGHDANAYGRMDALLFEINQAWCYDLIEKYCCCIIEHLPTMQKNRECPEETVEAVATFIFAAARFSDLPELVDLRSCFTARYGSYMESETNAEFVVKMQKKSFSQNKKLQLMQEITQEFAVSWDVKSFEYMISNSLTPTIDQPRINFSSSNEYNKQSHISDERKEVPDRSNEMANGIKTEHNSRSDVQNQKVQPDEHRSFHTTPNNAKTHHYDSTEKIDKVTTDESGNFEPHYFGKRVRKISDSINEDFGSDGIKSQTRNDKAATMIPPYRKFTGDLNGISSSSHSFVHSTSVMENIGQLNQNDGAVNPENYNRTSNLRPPYVKPKVTKSPLTNNSSSDYGDYLKNAPFFLRTKHLEQATTSNSDSSGEDGMHKNVNNQQNFISSQSKQIDDDPICGSIYHGRSMYRTISYQPSPGKYSKEGSNEPQTPSIHSLERVTAANTDSSSEYSMHMGVNKNQNFIPSQSMRTKDDSICGIIHHGRRMYRAFSDQPHSMGDSAVVQEKTTKNEKYSESSAHAPFRTTSLPSTETLVRKQVRSLSMQHDQQSANGGRLHPKLPNYDELAARIATLRNS